MRSVRAGVLMVSLFALGCADGDVSDVRKAEFEGAETTEFEGGEVSGTQSEFGLGSGLLGGKVFGVDAENHLVVFRLRLPGLLSRRVRITGTGGEKVVGIDFRPSAVAPATATVIGKLYGITKTRIYEIDPKTGYASNGQLHPSVRSLIPHPERSEGPFRLGSNSAGQAPQSTLPPSYRAARPSGRPS